MCALARRYLKAKYFLVSLFGAQAFKVSASMDLVIVFYFVDQAPSQLLSGFCERRSKTRQPRRSATSGKWPPRFSRSLQNFVWLRRHRRRT